MDENTPLTSNERALAISVLVVGGLISLVTVFTIISSAYVLATGHAIGGEASQALAQGFQKNEQMKEVMQRQLAVQSEIQARWAPKQLIAEGSYLIAIAGAMLFALLALTAGKHRARIGQFALLASGVRIGVGIITFLMTSEIMRSTTASIMAAMPQGQKGLSPEKAAELSRITQGAMAGISILSAGCWTLVVCIYFAVVAYMFLLAKPKPPPSASPAA